MPAQEILNDGKAFDALEATDKRAGPLAFKDLLSLVGIEPSSVRLLRHQDHRYPGHPTPYVLWRDHRDRFEAYQSTQAFAAEAKLRAPVWASFVGLPGNETLFVGLYAAQLLGPMDSDRPSPVTGRLELSGSCNEYRLVPKPELAECIGRLWVGWGKGFKSWIQRGDGTPKPILELRANFSEPEFPGFANLIISLSELQNLPSSWIGALAAAKGVYLLTCPRTQEHYVGMTCGFHGFLGRWREYATNGHGGNVGLKSRDLSDYQVSILQTVGSDATETDILKLEELWKRKLKSPEIGLNRNGKGAGLHRPAPSSP